VELPALAGWTVGVTADRRREEQAELLSRRGARVVHGASVHTLPIELGDGLEASTAALIDRPPDVVVLHTGLGTRAWFVAAESTGQDAALRAALRRAEVVARGPKAAGAAVTEGLVVSWQAPTETSAEIVSHLRARASGLDGVRIAVQRDGSPEPYLAHALRALGAEAVDVPVYRWQRPEDPDPAVRLIQAVAERRVDAVTFTSTPAVDGFVGMADEIGAAGEVVAALNDGVAPVCVGPVCSAGARRHGIEAPVEPGRARLGAMVQALVGEARRRRREVVIGKRRAVLQGSLLAVGAANVELTARERGLVAELTAKPGSVVAKGDLLRRVWGRDSDDPHVVEVTVARLRGRLEAVGLGLEAVPRRGYRLVPAA
jgi:uroporphyrinogen-III synthase